MSDPDTKVPIDAAEKIAQVAVCPACREAVQTLADELHDGMIQRIIAAKMIVEGQLARLSAAHPSSLDENQTSQENPLHHDLASVAKWLDESLLEARSILDQLQLATEHEPISDLMARWSNRLTDRVQIHNRLPRPFDKLSPAETQIIARVFQTVIGNLLQHSNASVLDVEGQWDDSECIMEFRDNGRNTINEIEPGVGLTAVERRMQSIGGSAAWTCHSTGFCVRIIWPRA